MNHKYIFKLLKITSIIFISLSLQCCVEKDKQVVLTDSMEEDIISEEDQILNLIREGNSYLNSKEFYEAKKCYEKAISKDITNEPTYLQIKNSYFDAKRYDDAYYIIKLAIDNNVSRESMENLLKDIKSHFSPTLMAISIHEGDNFTLPQKVTIPINDIDTEAAIKWDKSKVDTSAVGVFQFEGFADEYGRTVSLSLNISENPLKKSIEKVENKVAADSSSLFGYIESEYNQLDNTYIVFDEIQFFDNPIEAKKEYLKDHAKPSEDFFGDSIYYRNTSQDTKAYKLSPSVVINLCEYAVNSSFSVKLTEVSLDTFNNYVKKFEGETDCPRLLFKITLTNNLISKIDMVYIS